MGWSEYGSAILLGCALAACGGDDGDGGAGLEQVEDLPEVTFLNAVWSFGPNDVWVAADAGRMLHYDGAAWGTTTLGPAATMVDLWGFAPDDLYAVGGSTLAHFDGASWTQTDLSAVGAGISSVGTVWGTSGTDLWLGGDQSTAAHFDGTTWTREIAGSTDNVALWGSAPDDVYIGGVFDVAHYDGAEWTVLEDAFHHRASAIFGFGPDDVWVADDSELSHFDGGTWETTELEGIGGASRLWGPAPDDIWGVGDFGVVVRYDGASWDEVQSQPLGAPYLQSFIDVHGSSSADVWVVGVQHGDDGSTPQLFRRPQGG